MKWHCPHREDKGGRAEMRWRGEVKQRSVRMFAKDRIRFYESSLCRRELWEKWGERRWSSSSPSLSLLFSPTLYALSYLPFQQQLLLLLSRSTVRSVQNVVLAAHFARCFTPKGRGEENFRSFSPLRREKRSKCGSLWRGGASLHWLTPCLVRRGEESIMLEKSSLTSFLLLFSLSLPSTPEKSHLAASPSHSCPSPELWDLPLS